jgi:hypothetical protein
MSPQAACNPALNINNSAKREVTTVSEPMLHTVLARAHGLLQPSCHLRLATLCSIDTTACSALSATADPPCGMVTAPPCGMAFRERLTAAPRRLAAGLALCGIPAVQSPRSPAGPAKAGQDMRWYFYCRRCCLVQLRCKRTASSQIHPSTCQ